MNHVLMGDVKMAAPITVEDYIKKMVHSTLS